ncbi:hypothetical protein Lser_V15G13791 [Lactuca serriola]
MAEPRPPRNTITRYLPQEILFFQILPRLPVKALPNVMCVCKKWYLFLNSGAFATTYHHHVTTNDDHENHHKQFILTNTDRPRFHSIDCETPEDGLTAGRRLPLAFSFNDKMVILTSLHGLLCVGTGKFQYSDECTGLILWNPLTGDCKGLSNKGCHDKECYTAYDHGIFGLYYISSLDDYRLLRVTYYPSIYIYIYSLKSDSWRKVESTENIQQKASKWASLASKQEHPSQILLNEKLYFLKQVDIERETFIKSYSVMRFDTKTEEFTEIAMPCFGNQRTRCLGFMVLRGCIHFCISILIGKENNMTNSEMIELWRMDGDKDWTKVLTYGPMSFFLLRGSLLHFMRNGNLLLQNEGNVYVFDMKKDTKEMVFTYPINPPNEQPYQRRMDSNISPIGKYIETTVSPKQHSVHVRKWFLTPSGLEWCTVRSWQEYDAYERSMIEKYGEDITEHTGNDVDLWALSQGGRKDHIYGIGSSNHNFAVTKTPSYGHSMLSIEYVQSQLQIRELQIQMEKERKAREDLQDQITKEREIERKSRKKMQAQISELMRRFGNHHGNLGN